MDTETDIHRGKTTWRDTGRMSHKGRRLEWYIYKSTQKIGGKNWKRGMDQILPYSPQKNQVC